MDLRTRWCPRCAVPLALGALLISGCSGSSRTGELPQSLGQNADARTASTTPLRAAATLPASPLYVGDDSLDVVDVYDAAHPGGKIQSRLTGLHPHNGVEVPGGMSADKSGNVYVTDSSAQQLYVQVYAPGKAAPTRTLSNPKYGNFDLYVDVAVGSDDRVYVDKLTGVDVFEPGKKHPSKTLTYTASGCGFNIHAVAVDAKADVFVTCTGNADGNVHVIEFAAGGSQGQDIGLAIQPGTGSAGIAVDRSGNVLVSDGGDKVDVFAPGASTPSRTIAAPGVTFFALDATEATPYVVNAPAGEVDAYDYATGTSSGSFKAGLHPHIATGVAIVPADIP